MRAFDKLGKAHTIVLIGSILVGAYDTYKRLRMDQEDDKKDKEIERLKTEIASLKKRKRS